MASGCRLYVDARLWEISENLHRAELSALERAEHVDEWMTLTESKQKAVSAQPAQKRSKRGVEGALKASRIVRQ
jgi:hypothetical protein